MNYAAVNSHVKVNERNLPAHILPPIYERQYKNSKPTKQDERPLSSCIVLSILSNKKVPWVRAYKPLLVCVTVFLNCSENSRSCHLLVQLQ